MKYIKIPVLCALVIGAALNWPVHAENRKAIIELKSDKIIELAFFSMKKGKESRITQEYLPGIMPIAAKYGGKLLGGFQVTEAVKGEIQPQGIGIWEWESLEKREGLFKDSDAKKLFPIRDDALSFFKLAYFTVEEHTTLVLKEGKMYEFFSAWLTPKAKDTLPEYFEKSAPVRDRYGPPRFLASLKPLVSAPHESFILRPDMAGIVEWNKPEDYFGMNSDPEFKKNAEPLLKKSLSRMDLFHTLFAFPPQ